MAKLAEHLVSPTVAAILSAFLEKLETDAIVGSAALKRLRSALEEQRIDPASLRGALFNRPDDL